MKQPWHVRILVRSGIGLLLLWSLVPIYWTLASSLTATTEFNARPVHFYPHQPTFEHFGRLLGILDGRMGGVDVAGQFRLALLNSMLTSGAATIVCVLMSVLAAYAFARLEFPGRQLNRAIFPHPRSGRINIYQVMEFLLDHLLHHQQQLERITKALRPAGPVRTADAQA